MRKVLIVSYHFPPVGGAGVQRPTKFVKYLRQFGWEPIVITVTNPSVPVEDHSLLKDIPKGIKIFRAHTLEPSYQKKQQAAVGGNRSSVALRWLKKIVSILLVPDLQILWWPGLIVTLGFVVHKERPDCIYVTAPPFSSLVPVVLIGKLLRVPVLVDFRDEWVFAREALENTLKGAWPRFVDDVLERFVIRYCSGFIGATQSYVDGILLRHGSVAQQKGATITNGFDENDFDGVIPRPRTNNEKNKIIMLYTGTLWKATSLKPFLSGLSLLVEQFPELKERLRVKVIGRVVEGECESLQTQIISNMISVVGYMEHEQVLCEMLAADLLLLTLSDLPGAERIIPGKTFEYIAVNKPVLAIVPAGETELLLRECRAPGEIVHPNAIDEIARAIYSMLSSRTQIGGHKTARDAFTRRTLTQRLATELERIT